MAKRNPNDRNQMAINKRQGEKTPGIWTADDGREIKLKKPDLMFIQQASMSVEMPEEPTYEVKVGNKTREYPLDALVIKQTEDPVERAELRRKWLKYSEDLNAANNELGWRATGATFFEGTEPDAAMIEDDAKWQKRMRVTGWAKSMPKDPDELWVFYLQTSLGEPEQVRLSTAIVLQAGGVSEEQIKAAENMFFDELSTGQEQPGDVEDSGADEE